MVTKDGIFQFSNNAELFVEGGEFTNILGIEKVSIARSIHNPEEVLWFYKVTIKDCVSVYGLLEIYFA